MKTRKYVLTPSARDDLKGIWRYTKKTWGHEQAARYTNLLKATLEDLCEYPNSGRLLEKVFKDLRYRKSGKHYLFYFVSENQIQVVRILHEQMNYTYHLSFSDNDLS